jgi:serine/threonine-protein kinase PpkA
MTTPPVDIPGYQLLRQLGEGGMATVFLAVQKSLDRKVAIKILRTANDDDPERTERRFLREGRTLAKITHRNVCGIYDIAKVGDIAYIAMEFLDGGTLVDRQRDGISVGESIAITVQVASALQEAHNQGIVHRDLKPANVMMRGGKVPVLTDFGIARELTSHQTRITTENMIVGTPVYMSPEQVTGGEVDGRSDIYSLGIMFYELLTGAAPYLGDNPIQVCMQHLTAAVPVLPPALDEINPVLARMLAKKADDRFATMTEFTHALREVFVHSTQLRSKAELAPNQPWTEQLRQMGFSFDTLRDGELNSKLRQQQAAALAANRAADGVKAPTAELASTAALQMLPAQRTAASKKPLWLGVAAALIALIAVGYWQLPTKSKGNRDSSAIRRMGQDFDEQVKRGDLFAPLDDNAAQTIAEMRDKSEDSKVTQAKLAKLLEVVSVRIAFHLKGGEIDAANTLFQQALEAELLDDKQADVLLASITEARARLENKGKIDAQLAKLTQALSDPDADLFAELEALRELLPKGDTALTAAEAQVSAKLTARLELALNNDNLDAANRLLSQIKIKLPEFAHIERYSNDVRTRQQKLGTATQIQQIRVLLANDPPQIDSITLAASNLSSLMQSNPNLSELGALKTQLITLANSLALSALSQRNDIKTAQAVISALGEFKSDDAAKPARNAIIAALAQRDAALAAQRLAENSGVLVLDTAPFSTVLAINDANGNAIPVPAANVTPMRVTLLEGRYRIELSNGLGERKQIQAVVEKQKTRSAQAVLTAPRGDDYLREAGY